MKLLPCTEYTHCDQRSDKSFLVGVSYGKLNERDRILKVLAAAGIKAPEGV